MNMRLWTIHPKYLDCKGLVAIWREALLAKKVLQGRTKGYKNHPQLKIFKKQKSPIKFINSYLLQIWKEADSRNYNFDKRKLGKKFTKGKIAIDRRHILEEFEILRNKLKGRDPEKYKELVGIKEPEINPIFLIK